MVRRAYAQRSVFEVLLPDGDKLWSTELRAIDEILDDDGLVDLVDAALRRRHPLSGRRGRLGTPATVVLRLLVLKHLRDWSFDDCEREVRGSLVYRAFCRIDCERVPDAKTLIRLAPLLGPETLKPVLERVVQLARQRGVTRGQRLRVDTTVVETDIHYPTDSSLLADGVRVLTRTMKRLGARARSAGSRVRDRTRSVRRRVFEIVQRTRAAGRGSARTQAKRKARVTTLYKEVMAITRTVVRHADTMLHDLPHPRGRRRIRLRDRLRQTAGLVRRVLDQTRARVIKGDTHHPDKILSIFEPHTEVIRKGKAAKPTEFGKVVKIQEAEGQIITDYHVCPIRVPDTNPVAAGPRPASQPVWPRPAPGRRRRGVRVGGERTRRGGLRRQARGPATPGPAGGRGAGTATPALVPPRAAVAHRERRPHQCPEARSWSPPMSISRRGRDGTLGWTRDHRQQPARPGTCGATVMRQMR